MAVLAFIVDFEEGHLFPTFGLAKSLQERGHAVHYIGIMDVRDAVVEQGFQFHAILKDQYPPGFREAYKKKHLNSIHYGKTTFHNCVENELLILFKQIKPHGVIMSTYLCMEALLIHYRYSINPVIFMPVINSTVHNEFRCAFESLKEGQSELLRRYRNYNSNLMNRKSSFLKRLFGSAKESRLKGEFQQFISPLAHFKQIIACPAQFELPGQTRKDVHYIGPCIRRKTGSRSQLIADLKSKNKKIVYVSMGSQTERIHQVCKSLYLKIIELMRDPEMAEYHLVLSSAAAVNEFGAGSIPEGMTIVPWIDSLEILEISSAIITHGDLGLIKESIFYGVPMIVLPDKYDQPMNAERVVYHQLGVKDDLLNVTSEALKAHVQKITSDPNIRKNLLRMSDIFRQKDEGQEGAILIEAIFKIEGSRNGGEPSGLTKEVVPAELL